MKIEVFCNFACFISLKKLINDNCLSFQCFFFILIHFSLALFKNLIYSNVDMAQIPIYIMQWRQWTPHTVKTKRK